MMCPKHTTGAGPCYCADSIYHQAGEALVGAIDTANAYASGPDDLRIVTLRMDEALALARAVGFEDWARRAAHELQTLCDQAQEAAGNPGGDDQLPRARALLAEYECIAAGRPTWQVTVACESHDGHTVLDDL